MSIIRGKATILSFRYGPAAFSGGKIIEIMPAHFHIFL